jgi:hypothetical protein
LIGAQRSLIRYVPLIEGIDAREMRDAMKRAQPKPKSEATEPRLLTAEELRTIRGGDSGGGKIIIFQ